MCATNVAQSASLKILPRDIHHPVKGKYHTRTYQPIVCEIGASYYGLSDDRSDQLNVLGDELVKQDAVAAVIDEIKKRFGDRTILLADTFRTYMHVQAKIPFYSRRYF